MTITDTKTTLEDGLVTLRPLAAVDLEALYEVASDPLVWEQHPKNDRWKRDVFERFFKKALAAGSAFVITGRETGRVIGSSRYYDLEKEPDTVTIGYTFIAREFWGGEYNRSVKRLMLDHAFKFVSRVVFSVGSDNIRSQKALEKIGAVRSKVLEPDEDGNISYEYEIMRPRT